MTYKTILVHLDAGRYVQTRLELALQLAIAHEASVVGLYTTFRAEPSSFYAMAAAAAFSEEFETRRVERRAEIESLFDAQARRAGVPAEWHAPEGHPNLEAVLYARHADLIVAAREDPNDVSSYVAPRFVENLILAAGRPVLLVPASVAAYAPDQDILLAWDASREATRATYDALPLFRRARCVRLLTIDALEDEAPESRLPGADIATVLARHDVRVETVDVEKVPHRQIGKTLLERAAALRVGMIVAGAYGRPRALELTLGGVTRKLLKDATLPVLFSH